MNVNYALIIFYVSKPETFFNHPTNIYVLDVNIFLAAGTFVKANSVDVIQNWHNN